MNQLLIFETFVLVKHHVDKIYDDQLRLGDMYNYYDFGSYMIYSAYPQYKVFIDGRAEMYGPQRLKEYFSVIGIEPGWEQTLKKYNVNFIIINNSSIFSKFLLNNNMWKIVYSDEVADIFVRNVSENKLLIEKFTAMSEKIHNNL